MPAEDPEERQWIVEPPAPGRVSLGIACGEGYELSPDQERALGDLLRSLETSDAEVTGHAMASCPSRSTCTELKCKRVRCGDLSCFPLTRVQAASGPDPWSLMGSFGTDL